MYHVNTLVWTFFKEVRKGAVLVTSNALSSDIGQGDLVCYLVRDRQRSMVAREYPEALERHPSAQGLTAWSLKSKGMISEVFLEGCGKSPFLIANAICHELMHNKLDAHPSMSIVSDIHTIKNGRVCKTPTSESKIPNQVDIDYMRKGLKNRFSQYVRMM